MLLIIFTLIFLVWVYVLWVRDWLLRRLAGTKYGHYHNQIRKLWGKSRTVLVGRLYWLIGILVGLHDMTAVAGFDVTPVYREITNLLPEEFRSLALAVILYVTGLVIIKLRTMTAQDYEQKIEHVEEK